MMFDFVENHLLHYQLKATVLPLGYFLTHR
nr:MAG TPA: hypothetical protein [Siphoviridae sp. ctIyp7]